MFATHYHYDSARRERHLLGRRRTGRPTPARGATTTATRSTTPTSTSRSRPGPRSRHGSIRPSVYGGTAGADPRRRRPQRLLGRQRAGPALAVHGRTPRTAGPAANLPIHYTFDTPFNGGAAGTCGRVVYSDFHVESQLERHRVQRRDLPDRVPRRGAMTPQEKLLEFMLFDLTSCVSPPSCTPLTCANFPGTCGHAGRRLRRPDGRLRDVHGSPDVRRRRRRRPVRLSRRRGLHAPDVRSAEHHVRPGGRRLRQRAAVRQLHGAADLRRRRRPRTVRLPRRRCVHAPDVRVAEHQLRSRGRRLRQRAAVRHLHASADVRRRRRARSVRYPDGGACAADDLLCAEHHVRPRGRRLRQRAAVRDVYASADAAAAAACRASAASPTRAPARRKSCAQQNIGCGPAGDGCGNELQCGACTSPQSCGGGGVPGQCGVLDGGSCVPVTCASQGISCGPAGDGCGNLQQCGSCTPPPDVRRRRRGRPVRWQRRAVAHGPWPLRHDRSQAFLATRQRERRRPFGARPGADAP